MSKGVRTVVTAVTFMVAMAVCAVVVLDPEIDGWLLKYAVAIGASLAGIFLMGILILFVCTNVESEKADAIGTVVSLPFLYFGLMGLFLLASRIAIQRMLSPETIPETNAISSSLLLTAFVMVAIAVGILLIVVLWRTIVEDGLLVFAAILGVGLGVGICSFSIIYQMNQLLDAGVVQESQKIDEAKQPTLPKRVKLVLPTSEESI